MADPIEFPESGWDSCGPAEPAPPDCTCEEALAEGICDCIADQTVELVAALEALAEAINNQQDFEYLTVCNTDTGEWEHTVVIDGVETSTIATGIPCTEDPPAPPVDVEPVQECRNDTLHNVWYTIDPANPGTQTEVAAVDTGLPCQADSCVPRCVKWSTVNVQLDNTGTSFAEATTIEIENTDGSVFTFTTGPHAGWSDQVADIAAQMDAYYTSALYDPRCTFLPNGCGGLLPPPSDAPAQPGIFARYINGTHCPTDLVIPIGATASSATRSPRALPLFVTETPEKRGLQCLCCDGGPGPILDETGAPVPEADLPVCVFDCSETIPEPPLSVCAFETLEGPWCDIDFASEPDAEDVLVATDIVVTVTTCGTDQTIGYWTIEDDALVEYEPAGEIVNCDTLEGPGVEPPPCPEGAVFECVEVTEHGVIVDNSNWLNSPAVHIPNGPVYTVEMELADGTVTQQTGTSWWPIRDGLQALGYATQFVCDNWTGCNGTNPVPWGITPDINELFARGLWGVSCGPELVRVEIVDHPDAAWIGATRPVTPRPNPAGPQTYYKSVNCEGVFWKDCDGNDVPDPGCCGSPCSDPALDTIVGLLESVIGPCPACDGAAGGSGSSVVYQAAESDATAQSYGIGDVDAGNPGNGIKFDTANDLPPELTAAHQAIIDCIAAGGVANTIITDQDGATVELNLDHVVGDGNPQYAYEGEIVDGEPGSGKIRRMEVTCSVTAGDEPMCVRTGPNCPPAPDPIECAIVECDDPCANGSTYINGRPPASNPWSWGPYSAANLNDFEAALEAAGYTVLRFGEKHQICPPFGAFGEDPQSVLMNGIGEGFVPPVEPNINPDYVPDVEGCAVQTKGCNDDRRDDVLSALLEAQNTTNALLQQLIDCLCGECPECPALDVGAAAFTDDASAVSFPVTACNPTRDYAVPISFGPDVAECLSAADPATPIRVRWEFDHEIDPSSSHTGFNVSVTGAAAGNIAPVATSNNAAVHVGPGTAPHNGPRANYWADFDIPLSDLLAGVALQTSAFGTINTECETIHSQAVSISPDDVNLSAICDC